MRTPSRRRSPPFAKGLLSPKEFPEEAEVTFTFRLAKDLKMTVAEMNHRLSASEFQMWMAYYGAVADAEERESKKAKSKKS